MVENQNEGDSECVYKCPKWMQIVGAQRKYSKIMIISSSCFSNLLSFVNNNNFSFLRVSH